MIIGLKIFAGALLRKIAVSNWLESIILWPKDASVITDMELSVKITPTQNLFLNSQKTGRIYEIMLVLLMLNVNCA